MSSQVDADPQARLSRPLLAGAFWVPLAACTYLALAPRPPTSALQISDVLLHGFAFSYLTFALGLAHPRMPTPALAGWMLGYGIFIEVAQSFEPARHAEVKDLLVDGAGIAVGLTLVRWLGERVRRALRRRSRADHG